MKSIKDLWEGFHKEQGVLHLSDNNLGVILTYLDVVEKYMDAETILEIGVGTTRCTKTMVNSGKEVHCVDISDLALDKARLLTENVYKNTEMDELPSNYFDLAMSLCVIQHINELEFRIHLRETLRALKPDGIFSFQFAFDYDNDRNDKIPQDTATMVAGRCCKSVDRVGELVLEYNGEILWVSNAVKHSILGWHSMKIRRNDALS